MDHPSEPVRSEAASGPASADADQWFGELLQTVSDGVVGVGPDGVVRFVNAVAERILGKRAGELVGSHVDVVLRRAQVIRRRPVGINGSTRGALLVVAPRDTVSRETLGLMAAGVGHQINNLLQTILGNAEVLAGRLPKTPRAWRDAAERILATSEDAAAVVARMIHVARSAPSALKQVDLAELVRDVPYWLTPLLPGNITVLVDPGESRSVWLDTAQFALLVELLARNAADAMPAGGTLWIAAQTQDAEPGDADGQPNPTLVISDTGPGMAPEVLDHLFEPFFSTRRDQGHMGLGLSVVYELAHRHGGFVEVDSTLGCGTRVTVSFPSSPPTATPLAVPARAETTGGTDLPDDLAGTETVLVVEDSDAIRDLVVEEFNQLGYRVLQADRGDAALEIQKAHGGPIHLLVSDVMMPGMNGVELARSVREKQTDVRIIFLSGFVSLDINERMGRELGAVFVSKPFAFGVLAKTARQLLDPKQAAGQAP